MSGVDPIMGPGLMAGEAWPTDSTLSPCWELNGPPGDSQCTHVGWILENIKSTDAAIVLDKALVEESDGKGENMRNVFAKAALYLGKADCAGKKNSGKKKARVADVSAAGVQEGGGSSKNAKRRIVMRGINFY
jgi:hypothetical protein